MAKIPFWILPGSWGLSGKTRKIAQAEYYFKGYELDVELAKINHDDPDQVKKALLDVELKYEKLTQTEYEKQKATLLNEPWVSMPKISWDPINKNKTFFELDYNDHFIKYLRDHDYVGSDDEVLNKWLNDICISVIEEINDLEVNMITPTRRSNNANDAEQ
jgi:hypothetical protein